MVELDKQSVIIKMPRKCYKHLPNFGEFSEVCEDEVEHIGKDRIYATALDGYINVTGTSDWPDKTRVAFLESVIDANQTEYVSDADLNRITNRKIYILGRGIETKLYPYLVSANAIITLKKATPDTLEGREEWVQQWTVTLTKKNPTIKISLPELDHGGIETNTYNINKITECIDGKVWVKKYGAMSGETCGWKRKSSILSPNKYR